MMKRKYTVYGTREPRLVRDILKQELKLSANAIKRVKCGGLEVGGEAVTVRHLLKEGEVLTISFSESEGSKIKPLELPLDIVYEDEYLLAVNKPTDMPVHPCRGNHLPTLAEGVMHYLGRNFVFRAVNRLDRDTSGIVLIAKDADSAYRLGELLKRGEIQKEYVAITLGVPSPRKGVIDAPIVRECEGNIRRVVREDGKHALTHYEVLSVSSAAIQGEERTLARLRILPVTGRTHQIRVHLSHIGTPLLYDFLYGERVEAEHYFLHCERLFFVHPITKEHLEIVVPSPF